MVESTNVREPLYEKIAPPAVSPLDPSGELPTPAWIALFVKVLLWTVILPLSLNIAPPKPPPPPARLPPKGPPWPSKQPPPPPKPPLPLCPIPPWQLVQSPSHPPPPPNPPFPPFPLMEIPKPP